MHMIQTTTSEIAVRTVKDLLWKVKNLDMWKPARVR